MRVRIRTEKYELEYEGGPELWNEVLRPVMGGPKAPDEPEPEPAVRAAAPRPEPVYHRPHTVVAQGPPPPARQRPPRREEPRRGRDPDPRRSGGGGGGKRRAHLQPAPPLEASSDPATLYRRLAAIGGRRGEKDAVIAAVWFCSAGEARDVTAEDVERHMRSHGLPAEIKVRPHLLKHVSRTKLLDNGQAAGSVRLNAKGLKYVHQRLVDER